MEANGSGRSRSMEAMMEPRGVRLGEDEFQWREELDAVIDKVLLKPTEEGDVLAEAFNRLRTASLSAGGERRAAPARVTVR